LNPEPRITPVNELSWLSDVKESGPGLTPRAPIWVRHFIIRRESVPPRPECHPYCELGLHLAGSGVELVERERAERQAGDLFLAAPGVPHWFKTTRYPLIGIAIYFLPSLLCEMGPDRDGVHILRRFTARQHIGRRLLRPPAGLRRRFVRGFREIHVEFQRRPLGSEVRLRTSLLDMLVDLVRWERRTGREEADALPSNWRHVNRALHYLREHFAEPVYAHDVADAVGLSESRLKVLFREALGIPWSRYIQGYRIQQAAALLGSGSASVTDVALAVGFESPSHFNATFRAFMGVSPGAYLKRRRLSQSNPASV
jgi:AraC-like DNA-binding protein